MEPQIASEKAAGMIYYIQKSGDRSVHAWKKGMRDPASFDIFAFAFWDRRSGPWARRFVDFLAAGRQRYWQILPLNPTDPIHNDSPYSSISAFAGNPLLISPESFGSGPLSPSCRSRGYSRLSGREGGLSGGSRPKEKAARKGLRTISKGRKPPENFWLSARKSLSGWMILPFFEP